MSRWCLLGVLVACRASSPSTNDAPTGPAPALSLDRSCLNDRDCTAAPSCCGPPCTSDVINVKEVPRAQAALRCGAPCPAYGDCETHAYLCVHGECTIVYQHEPDYRRP
jgi:hypothetical protein